MSKPVDKRQKQDKELFSEAMAGIEPLEQDKIIPSSDKNRVFTPQANFIEPKDSPYSLTQKII